MAITTKLPMRAVALPLGPSVAIEIDKTVVNGIRHSLIQCYNPVTRETVPARSSSNPMILRPVLTVVDPNDSSRKISIKSAQWKVDGTVVSTTSDGGYQRVGTNLHIFENLAADVTRVITLTATWSNPYTGFDESITTTETISTVRESMKTFTLEPTTPIMRRVDPTESDVNVFSYTFKCGFRVKVGKGDYTMTGRDVVAWSVSKDGGAFVNQTSLGSKDTECTLTTEAGDISGVYRVRAVVGLDISGVPSMTIEYVVAIQMPELQDVSILPLCPIEVRRGSITRDTPIAFMADVIANGRSIPSPDRFYDIKWEVPNPINPEVVYRTSGAEFHTTMFGAFGETWPGSSMPTVSLSVEQRKTNGSLYDTPIGVFDADE